MKKALHIFFVGMGIVFLCILLGLGAMFLYISAPGSPAPTVEQTGTPAATPGAGNREAVSESVDRNPMLNESQESALETFGIDPASLPSTISPEQEACFIEAIGADRVEEIKAGDTPTATEIFRGRGCL